MDENKWSDIFVANYPEDKSDYLMLLKIRKGN